MAIPKVGFKLLCAVLHNQVAKYDLPDRRRYGPHRSLGTHFQMHNADIQNLSDPLYIMARRLSAPALPRRNRRLGLIYGLSKPRL